MNERQWEQVGAATGIGFVTLLLVSIFVAPVPPHIDASTEKILAYYADHRTALLTGAMLSGLAGILFIWFLGHLRHVLQRAEGGVEALSPIVYAAGITAAAVAFVCILPGAALAMASDTIEIGGNPALVRVLYDFNSLGTATAMLCVGLFVGATALAMVLKELVSPVLGWLGLAVTAVLLAAGIAGFYISTYNSFWTALTYVGLVAFAAFMLATSAGMLVWPEASRPKATPVARGPIFTR
ncbi:MAG TPA: hypothetical protein VGL92_05930 [Acidimicrobiia bacterium]|jgi:hypothetical protein